MSKAQKELESVFGTIPTIEALENQFLILGDGSSSSPNLRASEMLLTAIFVSKYPGTVLTNFYHGASFRESADKIGLWLRDNEFDFKLDRNLLEQYYIRYFGDPQMRLDNIVRRMTEKGKTEEEIQSRLNSFIHSLPVSVFTINGVPFVDFILQTRLNTTYEVLERLELTQTGKFEVEIASDLVGRLTIRDAIQASDPSFLSKYPVAQICCPECSLSNNGSSISHGVSDSGDFFKSVEGVSQGGSKATNCSVVKALTETLGETSILDLPASTLMDMGFKLSGKVLFILESLAFKNPKITQAIRDYTNPRGTVAQAADSFEGLTMLTPSIDIKVDDGSVTRDASIFELLEFMNTEEGLNTVSEFASGINLAADGKKRILNISNGTISITTLEP